MENRKWNISSKAVKMLTIHLLSSILYLQATPGPAAAVDWQELKGEHFIVYFTDNQNFAKDVLDKAEVYYQRIASGLGYPRYSDFWTWEKRARIYIYPDRQSFLSATAQPEWSHGMAEYRTKKISSYAWSEGFTDSLLPHEMAHLIFRDFVGFKGEVPLWLDEGVAQWAEEAKRGHIKKMAGDLYDKDTMLSLDDMMKIDLKTVTKNRVYIRSTLAKNGEKVSLILDSNTLIDIYYIQAASLINFLIDKYGSNAFANFCRELRDGKALEEALRFAYPTHIQDLSEMEKKWREYVAGT